jgi:hypothetical protein
MTTIKSPVIIKNFFSDSKYSRIMNYINSLNKNQWWSESQHQRLSFSSDYIDRISRLELDRARELFGSRTLLNTYSLLAFYDNKNSRLLPHKDDNACTYTIDICLYCDKIWPITVEGNNYHLDKNEALLFYGEDQLHSRPDFEEGNRVLMLFIHFAEPSHIFFQEPGVRV